MQHSSLALNFDKSELLAKFVKTGVLSNAEMDFLRLKTSRLELEAMAIGFPRELNLARRLYKICNRLFPTPKGQKKPAPAANYPIGMFKIIKEAKPGRGGKKIITGGGANGTSRRP